MSWARASIFVLIFAIALGYGFLFVHDLAEPRWPLLVWKGVCVWLLSIYAAMNARDKDGWLLTAALGFGALGDVLVENDLVKGAVAFAISWGIAMILYRRHARAELAPSQKMLAIALLIIAPVLGWLLTRDPLATVYSLIVAAMAACAWVSAFPRYRTGIGAILLFVSDMILFAGLGPWQGNMLASHAVWFTYFTGQLLVATSVVATLARWQRIEQLR